MVENGYFVPLQNQSQGQSHHNAGNRTAKTQDGSGMRFVEEEASYPASYAENEHEGTCPGNLADEIFIKRATNCAYGEEGEQISNLAY